MKTIKNVLLFAIMAFFMPQKMNSQQMYHIHEDVVKPAMTMEYEAVLKEILDITKNNPLEGINMLALQGYNNHYYYISPIASMADLDKSAFIDQLIEKAGQERIREIFTRMDKCYDIEHDYIIMLDNNLSYMPDGITQTPEGQNYREQYKIYIAPSKRTIVREKMQAVKNLYSEKQSKIHYRVYKSGFGTESEYYIVSIAAKDEMDMARKSEENRKLLGEEGQKVMYELFENVEKIEEIEGEMRPDLATSAN